MTEDVSAGPKLQWTFREAYVPGEDTLTVGHLWVWTERSTWNPVSGFGDIYSSDVWRNLADPAMTRHPFTGIPIAMRATYDVETAGPNGKLAVPADTQIWDANAGEWTGRGLRYRGHVKGHVRLQQVLPGAVASRAADHDGGPGL